MKTDYFILCFFRSRWLELKIIRSTFKSSNDVIRNLKQISVLDKFNFETFKTVGTAG